MSRWPIVLIMLILVGCTGREPLRAPSQASPVQVEKEQQLLQQIFFTDPCLAKLRQSAPELMPGSAQQGGATLYALEFPPNTGVRDGLGYQLHVKAQGRLAYLYASDGTAGSYRIYGPLPLGACLR